LKHGNVRLAVMGLGFGDHGLGIVPRIMKRIAWPNPPTRVLEGSVQLWEKREGLPIHRHQHQRQESVYAFGPELDAWRIARTKLGEPPAESRTEPSSEPCSLTRLSIWVGLGLLIAVVVVAGWYWLKPATPRSLAVLP